MKTINRDSNSDKIIWQEKEDSLYTKLVFKDFLEVFGFMKLVAKLAEEQNHHPRWLNEWNKLEIWLSTHEAGDRVTDKDYTLAEAISNAYLEHKNRKKGNKQNLVGAKLYTDGGSRGNPGPSAAAFVICRTDGSVVKKAGSYLGTLTNNQAEYRGLEAGLTEAIRLGIKKLLVYMDSELIVRQLNGIYKVKNKDLMPIFQKVQSLSGSFEQIEFIHVPRELNKIADAEVNRILDEKMGRNKSFKV